jgi:hypothetical protein
MKLLGNFGFSYIGLVWLLMLIIPNLIWAKNKPKPYEKTAAKENKFLLIFERIGQMCVSFFGIHFQNKKNLISRKIAEF